MGFFRKLVLTAAGGALCAGLLGATTPASAVESSWGCGGWCKSAPARP